MSVLITVVAAAAVLAAADCALAADLSPGPAPSPAPAAYSWNGLYLGLNAGYGSASDAITAAGGGVSAAVTQNVPGFVGGGQIGVNYQIGSVVWGFEADFNGSTQNTSISSGVVSGTSQMPWFGTLRGRLGLAYDRFLIYATAGGAGGELNSNFVVAGVGSAAVTHTFGTWTAGGGFEYGITDNISARIEYLYFDTGDVDVGLIGPPATEVTSRLKDNLVRAGVNYRFPVAW